MSKKHHQDKPPARVDKELEEFRTLMEPPSTFEDGFNWVAFLGALFVALLMVPGSIYMSLIAGQAVGPAAQWVTLILFIEVARRANKMLRRAEIFTLFYLSGAIMSTASMASGHFQGGLQVIWNQFYIQSDAAAGAGIASELPFWFAPDDQAALDQRSLLNPAWWPAIGLIAFTMIIGRLDNMILGYGLFRLTSDIERLPFPMAPIQAQGVLALSEEQEEESGKASTDEPLPEQENKAESWRWRVFSIGSTIGLVFGAIYLGIPTITGALLGTPITILPIPFIDYTQQTSDFLPAVGIAVSLNLFQVVIGMVLPFWAMVGTFVGLIVTVVANPFLYNFGLLHSWSPGDEVLVTAYKNNVDFYFSFSIGVALAIAIVGFWSVGKALISMRRKRRERHEDDHQMYAVPEGRGDIRGWIIAVVYLGSSALYIAVSMWLLQITDGAIYWPVVWVMCFYAFVYTPIISYVTARLEGIAGEVINIPFVREASFILSGYQGVAVWFLPLPLHNYGQMTVFYRSCELTGTSFWSIWKTEFILTPIILLGSLGFAHFIWQLGDIPGPAYPFATEMWEFFAANQSIAYSSTLGTFNVFEQALNGWYILAGGVIGLFMFVGLAWLGAPTFLTYGVVRGLNQTLPFVVIPQFVGALLGRYYFQKRLGLQWRQYIPVVAAGFACGMGLIGTLGIGFTFLAKSVFQLPF